MKTCTKRCAGALDAPAAKTARSINGMKRYAPGACRTITSTTPHTHPCKLHVEYENVCFLTDINCTCLRWGCSGPGGPDPEQQQLPAAAAAGAATDIDKYAPELKRLLACNPEDAPVSGFIVADLCEDVSWGGGTNLQVSFSCTSEFRQLAGSLLRAVATMQISCEEWTKVEAGKLLNSEDLDVLLLPEAGADALINTNFEDGSLKMHCMGWLAMYVGSRYEYWDNVGLFEQIWWKTWTSRMLKAQALLWSW